MEGSSTGRSPSPPGVRRPAGTLRRLLPHLRPYRLRLVLAATVSLGVLGAQLAQPQIVKRFVDEVLHAGMRERLVPYALAALVLGFAGSLFAFVRRNLSGSVSLGLEFDLRNRLYSHLQRLSVSFHDGWQSGQLVSRAVSDINRIRRFFGFGLLWLFILVMMFVGVLAMLFRIDAVLATVTLGFALPVAVISHRFARFYHAVSKQAQDEQGDLTTVVEESATGVRVIKAFGRMPERSTLFRVAAEKLLGTNMRAIGARARFWSLDGLLLGLNLVVILLWGGVRAADGRLSLGGLVAFVSYQMMLVWPVRDIGWIIAMAQEASAATERVFEILDTQPEVDERPDARVHDDAVGELRFEGVDFRYPGTDDWILRGLDLDLHPGETLAVVGLTGAGKTTVASLVPRFYDPTAGRLTIDGHDLRDLTLPSLRSHVGVVFEDPILFSASVRENLLMGRPEATDDEVWDALAHAHAEDFVRELPWGLDTRIGEQGFSLSGGQRQRVALARAVVGGPRVLVLDNPLSSVDVHTEAAIERALRQVLVGRTALLIAHRPSTILLADRVALLHEGRVLATGTHQELLRAQPLYREVIAAEPEDEAELEGVRV